MQSPVLTSPKSRVDVNEIKSDSAVNNNLESESRGCKALPVSHKSKALSGSSNNLRISTPVESKNRACLLYTSDAADE